jgi:uncharacterized membrane protein
MRTCWPGLTLASFNPFVSDLPLMLRHICMLGILGIRTFNSVLITLSHGMGPSIIPSILLGILFFFFIAYSLHLIGEMQGTRRVFRVSWGKWHFDAFLAITFLIHVGFVGGYYVGMPGTVLSALWMTMGLLIFVVSWIAWWEPESEASLPR